MFFFDCKKILYLWIGFIEAYEHFQVRPIIPILQKRNLILISSKIMSLMSLQLNLIKSWMILNMEPTMRITRQADADVDIDENGDANDALKGSYWLR